MFDPITCIVGFVLICMLINFIAKVLNIHIPVGKPYVAKRYQDMTLAEQQAHNYYNDPENIARWDAEDQDISDKVRDELRNNPYGHGW